MPAPLFLRHDASLGHDTGAHPERAARIPAIERELQARGGLGYEVRDAPEAPVEALLRVHPQSHVDAVRAMCETGGSFDLDTPAGPGSWEAALTGAGAAVAMVEALVAGEAPCGFCALRPPGHHAEPATAMGFCLFNSVAVGARHAIGALGLERVLILDWDVHHGNGTNAAFHASREVLFASIHQSPLYPGTGALSDIGSGEGAGYSLNLPVPPGSGEETFLGLLQHVVAPAARAFEPQLVLVSAGYDAHADDPLAECELTDSSYGALAAGVRDLAGELGVPFGAVLEGGYDLRALSASVAETLAAFAGDGTAPEVDPDAVTERSRAAHAAHWPL
ncbi:MAG TPA: histone deacetylase [Thermoleophilaceae bacterium]|nr:histone deacetylase [Thermoleophilaceae bacterium]